jgi:peptidoglycan/LPS O-acetylase OafA/YrhL
VAAEWAWLAQNVGAQDVDDRWTPRWVVPYWGFAAAQLVLLVVAVLADNPVDAAATYLVGLTGACLFTVGVLRRRPNPFVGWLLMIVAVWMVVAAAALAATAAWRDNALLNGVVPTFLAALSYPVMAVGLVVLSRSAPRARGVDVLDAAMTALAAFLLLWAFAIEARIDADTVTAWARPRSRSASCWCSASLCDLLWSVACGSRS